MKKIFYTHVYFVQILCMLKYNRKIMMCKKITLDFCLMHFLWKSELQLGISIYGSIELTPLTCRTLKLPTNDPI